MLVGVGEVHDDPAALEAGDPALELVDRLPDRPAGPRPVGERVLVGVRDARGSIRLLAARRRPSAGTSPRPRRGAGGRRLPGRGRERPTPTRRSTATASARFMRPLLGGTAAPAPTRPGPVKWCLQSHTLGLSALAVKARGVRYTPARVKPLLRCPVSPRSWLALGGGPGRRPDPAAPDRAGGDGARRHARPRDGHGRDRRRAELRHRGRAHALGRAAPPPRLLARRERGARRRVGDAGRRGGRGGTRRHPVLRLGRRRRCGPSGGSSRARALAPRSGPASASSSRRRRSRTSSSTPSASARTPCGRSWRACSPSRSAAGASTSTPASSSTTRCISLHDQRDFLSYGLALEWPATSRLALLAEVAGRAGDGRPGAEERSEARAGVRFGRGRVRWDVAVRRGLAKADGTWGADARPHLDRARSRGSTLERRAHDLGELRLVQLDRVALHAAGGAGLRDERRHVRRAGAPVREARDLERPHQRLDPRDAVLASASGRPVTIAAISR